MSHVPDVNVLEPVTIMTDGNTPIEASSVYNGVVDAGNTSEVPLGVSEVFTGVAIDTLEFTTIIISIMSDQPSAVDGLQFQFSTDGIIWKTTDLYTYNGGEVFKTYSLSQISRYFKVIYTNSTVAQTIFILSTLLKKHGGIASSHRIQDDVEGNDDATLSKTIIAARRPDNTYTNVTATPEGDLRVSIVTATGTVPVAQLTTLHDGKLINRMYPELNEVAGTGTGTYADNKYNMHVEAGEWSIITSRRYHPYYSGKPQKFEITFDKAAPQDGVIKRVGAFSTSTISPYDTVYDGLWLESGNGTISMKAARAGVLTIDTDITDWLNYARMKEYALLATWDNFTVIEFNYLWLGGAYVELKMITSDGFIVANYHVYAGTSQDVFMQSPNQPMRYEIRSTTGVGDFRYVCNQVATAGSTSESGLSKAVATGYIATTLSTIGTKYPVIALRKGATFRDNPILLSYISLLVESSDSILWSLEINPTLSATMVWTAVPNSAAEYAIGDGVITATADGIVIAADIISQGDHIPPDILKGNYLSWLGGALDGTMDRYVICATPKSTNLNLSGAIIFLEH